MPDWIQQAWPLVGTAIGAIGVTDFIRKWFAQRLDRQATSGNRKDSREASDWASLDAFRLEQGEHIEQMEARMQKQADDCAKEIRELRDEHRAEITAARLETQDWRERYFAAADELRNALLELAKARRGTA